MGHPWYRPAVALYDRLYCAWHRLDRPEAYVGSTLRVVVRPSRWTVRLSDGTLVRRGEPIGVLHLNNAMVSRLHADGIPPARVGFEFRRQLFESFRELAELTEPGGRLEGVKAFAAVTIFHRGLKRIGFESANDRGRLRWPRLVALYQRALLASLHPAGRLRPRRPTYDHAERVWISRERLAALYGGPDGPRPAAAERKA